jgi:hypothetical protein
MDYRVLITGKFGEKGTNGNNEVFSIMALKVNLSTKFRLRI